MESHFIPQRNSKIILYFNSKLNHSRKIVNIYIFFFSLYLFFASTLNLIWTKTFRAFSRRTSDLSQRDVIPWHDEIEVTKCGENCQARCPLWHPVVDAGYGNFARTAKIDALWILAGRKTRTERTVNYQGFPLFPCQNTSRLDCSLPRQTGICKTKKKKNHFRSQYSSNKLRFDWKFLKWKAPLFFFISLYVNE